MKARGRYRRSYKCPGWILFTTNTHPNSLKTILGLSVQGGGNRYGSILFLLNKNHIGAIIIFILPYAGIFSTKPG